MNPESWFLIGHIVCISQWCAFIMVDYAYLGKGRVRPLWLWTTVLVAGELFLGIKLNIGFFTLLSIWENVGFVLVSTLLFGGTLAQKLTAALINGTMCLLAENTVRYRIWSGDGMRAASLTEDPAEFSVIRCDPESGTWSRSWTIRELDDRATAVRDLSWLESGALLHITYETEKDGTLTVDFVPDAELTDPGDLCGYPAE